MTAFFLVTIKHNTSLRLFVCAKISFKNGKTTRILKLTFFQVNGFGTEKHQKLKCLVKCSTIYNQYFWDLFLVLRTVSDVSVTFYGHVNLNEELLCSIFGHISQHFWNYQLCLKSNFWTTISFLLKNGQITVLHFCAKNEVLKVEYLNFRIWKLGEKNHFLTKKTSLNFNVFHHTILHK